MGRLRLRCVIVFEDGGSQEHFFTKEKKLVLFADEGPAEPELFKPLDAFKQLNKLRPNYIAACRLHIVSQEDFEQRRAIVRAEKQAAKEARAAHRAWLDSLHGPDPDQ